jgi:predicted alpha/beta superfamily hydrolase
VAVAAALASGCGPKNPVEVTFNVSVPADTPVGGEVRLIGDAPPLGNGQAPGLKLARIAEGAYRGKAVLEAGSTLRYRVALGSPEASELTATFDAVPDRELVVPDKAQAVSLTVARWWYPPPDTHVAVKFEVVTPASSPGGVLYLAGNAAELGGWRPNGVALTRRASDGAAVTLVALPRGAAVQYKVTRGTWATVERGAAGEDIPNRTYAVPAAGEGGTAQATVATWKDQVPSAVLTGDIRYLRNVTSTILGNTRDVIIYLPPDYESSTARYPVLYMHDGQNLMDPRTTAFGNPDWGVDETAQRLIRNGQMQPIIVVGVYNTGSGRIDEYTQVASSPYGGGKADDYGRFLVEELKPQIDAAYRTRTDAASTGLAGSSLGGLVSMYLGLTRSSTFTRLGVISPSIWWAGKDIVTRTQALPQKLPLRIWEDMGTDEGAEETVEDARLLRDALVAKGWVLDADLKYLEVVGGQHNEAAWAARLDQILMYLYPP